MNVRIVGVERVWDCMLCTYVNEEKGEGERVVSEELSQLSYTLRYVSLTDLVRLCQVGMITCTGNELFIITSIKRELKTRPIYDKEFIMNR